MKTLIQLCMAMLLCSSISAQSVITRLSAGEAIYYYNDEIQDAISEASPGDTVLLPGHGYLTAPVVNNPIVLIGVGHDPVSSIATGVTFVSGLTLNSPCEVIGLRVTGNVQLLAAASGSVIQRCRVEGNITFATSVNNIIITECINSNPSTSGNANSLLSILTANNVEINNSLLERIQTHSSSPGVIFKNNVIFDALYDVHNSEFSCNVFYSGVSASTFCSNNIFTDNVVLNPGCTDACLTSDLGVNNVAVNTLFVSGTSVFGAELTDYPILGNDYLVLEPSPAFTHCPTNQQAGIFGGPQPFKIGSIPFNPHISSKSISGISTTDQVNVIVGAEAQDN